MKGNRLGNISSQDLDALIALFQESTWTELHLAVGETTLLLSKNGGADLDQRAIALPSEAQAKAEPRGTTARASPPAAAEGKPAPAIPDGWTVVRAPSLGTFYRSPKPGSAPYCEAGQTIGSQQELGLLEVMKLFTTVRSGVAGTVREILAKDGELVEFDQPLFLIEPDA
jgi:acetyl-CoA carboxylase biotin carboxyl carrier protein